MKKIVLFSLLCIFAFTTKAQELNFEETVKYIQGKLQQYGWENQNYGFRPLKVKNSGDIEVGGFHFNFFDLNNINATKADEFGIEKVIWSDSKMLCFNVDGKSITCLYFKDEMGVADLERIYKAVRHLRSLCTKEKDPFDN